MKLSAIILLLIPAASYAANKEMQELQRDVALMQEDIRQLQRTFDQQIAALRTQTQQSVDNSNRIATSVSVLEQRLPETISRQTNSALAPVAGLNTRLDQVANQVQTLADAMQSLNSSMQQLRTQVDDLKNIVKAIQVPAAAPPPSGDQGIPGSPTAGIGPGPAPGPTPPPPAEILYQNAKRDMDGGKPDMAMSEFAAFIKYYPTSDLAPNSQFYIGTIHYGRNEYEDAVKAFDAVLEQYPKNNKTADAYYYKGMSLFKMGRSRDARKEFNSVIQQFPRTEAAQKAQAQMRTLGFNTPAKGRK